jgi:hypothetical protein
VSEERAYMVALWGRHSTIPLYVQHVMAWSGVEAERTVRTVVAGLIAEAAITRVEVTPLIHEKKDPPPA